MTPGRSPSFDAVVIGAGPNGLVAAVEIARAGRRVVVLEAADQPGGGLRTEELTLPGFRHDVCAAILPLAIASPALRDLDLDRHGVRWVHPTEPLAHPLDGGAPAVVLSRDLDETCRALSHGAGGGEDAAAWRSLMRLVTDPGEDLVDSLLAPLRFPRHPVALARFGVRGIATAERLARRAFSAAPAAALFAGLAAHSMLRLDERPTAAYGLLLGGLAHRVGWPMAAGGSSTVADALVSIIEAHGGEVVTGQRVRALDELPSARVVIADISPRELLAIGGEHLGVRYRRRLEGYRYGPGVFKVDWALSEPVPWADPAVARAGTVHLGGTFAQIAAAEAEVVAGRHAERPFVLLAQQSLFDASRAPAGAHTLWGYCHVPNGSTVDMTAAIESQIERFAPGFADVVLARHSMNTSAMAAHGLNYVGGDINGGRADLGQLIARPVLSRHPWRVPIPGWYLCSASTPPGGGVHGMGGREAARLALAGELRD
jgi:phytoene dehydrogenase-like protein